MLGFNTHMSYFNDRQWSEYLMYVENSPEKPLAALLLDSFGNLQLRALDFARRFPNTVTIYRRFIPNPGGGGDNHASFLSPHSWLEHHSIFRNTNVYCTVDNEPQFNRATANFHEAVMKLALANNIKCSVGGFSVGVPEPADISIYHGPLKLMSQRPDMFILDLHEYARSLWCSEWDRDAWDPARWPTQTRFPLWHMGRFQFWNNYCANVGLKPPRIVIGEWGWDHVGSTDNYGPTSGIITNLDLWRSKTGRDVEYGIQQLKAAWKTIYANVPNIIGVCFYQLSGDENNWRLYNPYYLPGFLSNVTTGFQKTMTDQPNILGYEKGKYTLTSSGSVNLRSSPTTFGAVVQSIQPGDSVEVLDGVAVLAGNYYWQKILSGGRVGYMAIKATSGKVSWSLVPVPPTADKDEVIAEIIKTLDEAIAKIKELLKEI